MRTVIETAANARPYLLPLKRRAEQVIDMHTMERKERVSPLDLEIIGYPPCQCTGAAYNQLIKVKIKGVKARTVYLRSSFFK
jgi:hypothetical protein